MDGSVERIERDGVTAWRSGEVASLYRCAFCGLPFVPTQKGQKACSAQACQSRRNSASKLDTPEKRERARAKSRAWAAANRACETPKPWLRGAPSYGTHLPGGGCEIHVWPPPKWPVEHRNIRQLHGMVTACTDEPHARWPVFALVPWPAGIGWGVYVWKPEVALRIAGRTMAARLYDSKVQAKFGPLVRVKAPGLPRRGRQRVRIDTVTPVVVTTEGRSRSHIVPTPLSLLSALTAEFPLRLGLDDATAKALRVDGERTRKTALAQLELVEHDAHKATVEVGAKYGTVVGWEGSCVVEVNAPARWLLECAARVGLGGRTAFGFGRIRVTAMEK